MGAYLPLIIQLIAGALGGNLTGALAKNLNMGTLWNSVAGIVGGGLGGQILSMIGMGGGGADPMSMMGIISSIAGGGVGGGVIMAIVGLIRKAMAKS